MTLPAPDYRELRREFNESRGFKLWGFPMPDCVCAVCGSGGCCLYPDIALETSEGAPSAHSPSLICPQCSTRDVEVFIRWRCEQHGYILDSVSVFGVHE